MAKEKGRYPESPPFRYTISSGLAAGGKKNFNLAEGETKKYIPFNVIEIYNASEQKIRLGINSDEIVRDIPESSIVSLEFDAIYDFSIENIDSLSTTDDINITVEKKLTERLLLKLIARKMGAI